MKKTCFIILLLYPVLIFAQAGKEKIFTSGYIVTVAGDTVYGKLALLNEEESCGHVIFKRDTGQTEEKMNAKEVKHYKRGMEFYYSRHVIRPSGIGNKDNFVKLLKTGNVNVYRYDYKQEQHGGGGMGHMHGTGSHMYLMSGGSAYYITEYYLEKESLLKRITRLNYKNDLWGFFKGDKEMVTKVRKTQYDYEEIPRLIDDYNKEH